MKTPINVSVLNSSLQRCLNNDNFIRIFYELFLQTSDEIAELFKNTDLEHQMEMMQQSLDAIISVSEANWESDQFIANTAATHKARNIRPEFYKFWEISLLAAVAECDPDYNEETRKAWKHLLNRGINFMIEY